VCESGACALEYPSLFHPPTVAGLLALVKDRNAPQKHVPRAEIVLLSATRRGLPGSKPLGDDVAACIVALTLDDPPDETTHWTGALWRRPLASRSGVSVQFGFSASGAHGLQPHRVRQFKLSNDPKFVDKLVFYNDAYA